MIAVLAELVIAVLLVAGGFFGLVGSWGLVKFPDAMTRLHAPTKAATLGVGCILIASMLDHRLVTGTWSWHEMLIALFVALTSPVTALFLAKSNMHLSWSRASIPRPAPVGDWLTFTELGSVPERADPDPVPAPPDEDRGWE